MIKFNLKEYTENENTFNSLINIYDFFSPRSKNLTVWSIGLQKGEIESYFAENLGCEIKIFDGRSGKREYIEELKNCLEKHSFEETNSKEIKEIIKKWIKPNQFNYSDTLPFTMTGTMEINGEIIKTKEINNKENEKVDILKLDLGKYNEILLYSVINEGYRPGLIYIHWESDPDNSVPAMIAAGNLQTIGYRLLGSSGKWYTYMFSDECMYEITSWNRTDNKNPMFEEYKNSLLQGIKR